MELMVAILVFVTENYLKLVLVIAPICSLWRYYNSSRHVYIIILELVLLLVIALIMFASLALTKMDCNRIANYFMLPVLLGLAYFDIAHYHRQRMSEAGGGVPLHVVPGALDNGPTVIGGGRSIIAQADELTISNEQSIVDTVELVLANALGFMTIVQLAANSFGKKLSKITL